MRTQQAQIPVSVRTEVGKSAARRLRAAGRIPAVVYGRGMASLPVWVEERAFARALPESAWHSTLVQLRIEGDGIEDTTPSVVIAQVQRDPARQRILSIDFHRISLQERVHTQVPVIHSKQSPGVRKGGILEHIVHELMVECLAADMPDHLEADISALEIGDALRVSDLVPPPGVKILAPPHEVVVLVAPPLRAEEVAAPAVPEGAVVEETEEPEVIRERPSRE